MKSPTRKTKAAELATHAAGKAIYARDGDSELSRAAALRGLAALEAGRK